MSQQLSSTLPPLQLKNKRVIVRIDGNVPLSEDGKIQSYFRLQHVRPTLDHILLQNAQIILLTHIGRPKNKDKKLSTHILYEWFCSLGYDCIFAQTLQEAKEIPFKAQQMIILENIRFFDGEQKEDLSFAQELASLGEFYVNDAFGVMHRHDTSTTLLPKLFKKTDKSIGFLVKKELKHLTKLHKTENKPFIAIIGGGKVETKLSFLAHLTKQAYTIIVLPALSFSFEKLNNKNVGKSLIHEKAGMICNTILQMAQKHNTKIILPIDYLVADNTIDGKLSNKTIEHFSDTDIGIAIGPKTLSSIEKELQDAKSIFFNGIMGFAHLPETQKSSKQLLEIISQSSAYTIIAGGDTVSFAQSLDIIDQFDFVSTGGGAALAYIAGERLPGLEAMEPGSPLSRE